MVKYGSIDVMSIIDIAEVYLAIILANITFWYIKKWWLSHD